MQFVELVVQYPDHFFIIADGQLSAYLVKRKAKLLQGNNTIAIRQLCSGIVPIPCKLVDSVRHKQSLGVVISQGFDRYAAQL